MKTKFFYVIGIFFMLTATLGIAQEKTITGNVQDSGGIPLPGVNILVKGTSTGTQSDFDGNFSIKSSVGQTLVFSYLGFVTQEVSVTSATNSMSISLIEDAAQLDEVVVTALGIKKEKKALGYAVTTLGSEDIEQKATGDLTRILQGKAAGVDIISASGLSGAGSSVTIRGLTSTGNNQPLYVVDGVRFNSATNGTGFSGTSRFLDIDPNNIDTVNVLKGLAASALYGSAGKNGVIVITTKASKQGTGAKKTEVTLTASTVVNEIASLPDFTQQRGQGYYDAFYNFFGNFGATFGNFGVGNVDSSGQVPHPYGLNSPVFQDAFPDLVGSRVDYRNYNSQENFFQTGIVQNYNVNVNGGGENSSFNVSIGNLEDDGFLPGNKLRRTTFSAGGNANLTNKLNVNAALNLSTSNFNSPFTGDIFNALFNTPRSIDLAGFPNQHPVTGQEISFQNTVSNPYWVLNNTNIEEDVTRVFGNVGFSYALTDKFSVSYKYGNDVSIEQRKSYENRGNVAGDVGALSSNTRRQELTNHTIIGSFNTRFSDDLIGLDVNAGADLIRVQETLEGTNATTQTIFDSPKEFAFFEDLEAFSGQYAINTPGVFAQMTLDYDNYLFLTASARNDWTSNFVDNSQFYPGVGISFIPTIAFDGLKSDVLSYFKVRAGYGTSADFNVPGNSLFGLFSPYPTFQGVGQNANAFIGADGESVSVNSISNQLANAAIGPALVEEYEFGFESKFWKNRITVDATYYDRTTTDLIFNRALDPSTGFTDSARNVNELNVNGVEIEFNVQAIKSEDFSFDIGGNFTRNRTEVVSLEEDRFPVAQFGTLGNYLVEGQPINVILGTVIDTDDDGNFLLDGRDYILAEDIEIIGDPNPDYILSTFGNIRYKNLNLSANVQYRSGGDIYSSSARSLLGRGLTTESDNLQNAGYVLPGVDTTTGEQNEVVISSGDAFFNLYNNGSDQFGIFDATTIRLQELALTYRFDDKVLNNTPLGSLSLSVIGENLYFRAINIPKGLNIDTNSIGTGVNSNGQGIEGGISPTSRRIGVSIKASF